MKTTNYFFRIVAVIYCLCSSVAAVAHEHDTLKCHFSDTSTFTYMLYRAPGSGYMFGNNADAQREIAQKFGQAPSGDTVGTECSVPDQHQLNEILVWFGAKKVTNPNDSVYIKVYTVNHATEGPDSLLGISFPITMAFIDTSSTTPTYTDFLMQLPIIFTDSFFVSVALPQEFGDTVGIITSTKGQALNTRLCWLEHISPFWYSELQADSFNIDAVILPEVGDEPSGIAEQSSPIVQANAFPNPANENTVISYSLAKSVPQMRFSVVDISGKVVYSRLLNNGVIGKNFFNIDTGILPSGTYFYSFDSNGKKYNGKLEIIR